MWNSASRGKFVLITSSIATVSLRRPLGDQVLRQATTIGDDDHGGALWRFQIRIHLASDGWNVLIVFNSPYFSLSDICTWKLASLHLAFLNAYSSSACSFWFLDSSAVFERFARDTFPFGCLAVFFASSIGMHSLPSLASLKVTHTGCECPFAREDRLGHGQEGSQQRHFLARPEDFWQGPPA